MTETPKKRPGRPRARHDDTDPASDTTQVQAEPVSDGHVTVTVRPGTLVVIDGQQVGGEVRVPRDLAAEWIRQHWADSR